MDVTDCINQCFRVEHQSEEKCLVRAGTGRSIRKDYDQYRINDMNREFGLLNLMNTPEHCSAPFHSVSSKVAKSTKMAAAHIQTYVLHVTWSILYTYLITPPEPVRRHGESKCFELGEF